MKYFLHDSNAFNDEKITELFLNFGYEGLGLFYTILEKLASQEKPMKTIVLKAQLKVGKKLERCWLFMEQIELISSNNGDTFNKQLLNFSEKYNIKKEKNTKRISEWRKNQEIKENVTCYESVSNTPKVNESKVNINKEENKENTLDNFNIKFSSELSQFDEFRILYQGSKRGNETEFRNFIKHKDWRIQLSELKNCLITQIEQRKKLKESNKFVPEWKMLQTWINQRCWEETFTILKEPKQKPKLAGS